MITTRIRYSRLHSQDGAELLQSRAPNMARPHCKTLTGRHWKLLAKFRPMTAESLALMSLLKAYLWKPQKRIVHERTKTWSIIAWQTSTLLSHFGHFHADQIVRLLDPDQNGNQCPSFVSHGEGAGLNRTKASPVIQARKVHWVWNQPQKRLV